MFSSQDAVIVVPALRVSQSKGKVIFQYSIDGKQIPRFAAVARIRRDEDQAIAGYQRTEVSAHITSIRKYIESLSPMIPNSIVIAFKEEPRFEPFPDTGISLDVQVGRLFIPALRSADEKGEVIGWIVDGQQRCAAIRSAKVDRFPIPITSFVAETESEQREQFILVNSAKPLAKGLIFELLPSTETLLPVGLARKRLAATVLAALNSTEGGPFFRKIQTPTNPEGTIKDNTILRMLDHSILDGVLYNFRDPETGTGDVGKMTEVISNFFGAVRDLFPDDWEKKPRQSRLVHGVGIVSLGFLMDEIAGQRPKGEIPEQGFFKSEVEGLVPYCHWSSGQWELPNVDRRKKEHSDGVGFRLVEWNELQNTTRDLSILTSYILDLYRTLRTEK